MRPFRVLPIAVVLAAATATAPEEAQSQDSTLTGTWQLNQELSDNPAEQLQDLRAGAGRRAGGRQPQRRGAGGGARTGRRNRGSGDVAANQARMSPQQMQATMAMVRNAARRFLLEIGEDSVRFTYTDRLPVAVELGEKWKEELPDGIDIEWKAERRDGGLRVERQVTRGGKLREDYQLSETGHLEVVTRLEMGGGQRPIEFTRVYDRSN